MFHLQSWAMCVSVCVIPDSTINTDWEPAHEYFTAWWSYMTWLIGQYWIKCCTTCRSLCQRACQPFTVERWGKDLCNRNYCLYEREQQKGGDSKWGNPFNSFNIGAPVLLSNQDKCFISIRQSVSAPLISPIGSTEKVTPLSASFILRTTFSFCWLIQVERIPDGVNVHEKEAAIALVFLNVTFSCAHCVQYLWVALIHLWYLALSHLMLRTKCKKSE